MTTLIKTSTTINNYR